MSKIKELFKDKLILGLSIGLAIVAAIIIGMLIFRFVLNQNVTAISFSQLTKDEITEWYVSEFHTEEGLKFEYEYSDEIAKDKVISQSVAEGEKINKKDGLTIVLSDGADPEVEFELPDFVKEKYDLEKIQKYFEDNKFPDVTYQYVISDEPLYTVIDINVSGKVKRGTAIIVTISAADDVTQIKTNVPDLKTYSLANARAWASSYAINLTINFILSDSETMGKILSQTIAPNTEVTGGTEIRIEVVGKEVPNVVGKTQSQAVSALKNAGFSTSVSEEYSSSVEKGTVISTSPKASSVVENGSKVKVVVSAGPNPANVYVTIKDKVGTSESSFKSYITGLGLSSPSHSGSYYSDSVEKGMILSHTSGRVNLLTKVTYELSKGAYSLGDGSRFNGMSLSSAQKEINNANDLRAGVKFNYTSEYSDSVSKNELYGCSVSGKTLTCKVSKGKLNYYAIPSREELSIPGNYNQAYNHILDVLGGFDLEIVPVSDPNYNSGVVVAVYVDGEIYNASWAKYPEYTHVKVELNK